MIIDKAKLLYFADPMCSWCYGFSPEFSKLRNELKEELDFHLVMGGLRPHNTETMLELGDFLQNHWDHVYEKSGQEFKCDILTDYSFIYDTEPSCRAVVTIRHLFPHLTFRFFNAIQKAFYSENKNTNSTSTYLELAEKFGVDPTLFKREFESEFMRRTVKKDFEYAAKAGVRSFPTLVLQDGDQEILISNGYTKAEDIIRRCQSRKVAQ